MGTNGRRYVLDEVTLVDLIKDEYYKGNIKNFSWHKYIAAGLSWKEYHAKSNPKKTKSMHYFVLKTFLDLMLTDVIENNVQFDFDLRYEVFLSLLIADRDKDSYLYKYRINQRGHDFIPYCITSKQLWRQTKRYFIFFLHRRWYKYLNTIVATGKEYEPAPKVEYKKKRTYGLQRRIYRSQGYHGPDCEQAQIQGAQ